MAASPSPHDQSAAGGSLSVAVIGGGHGAYAAAADLSEQGHHVRLWRRDEGAFAPVLNRQAIVVRDESGEREVAIGLATMALPQAIAGADVVLVPLPAFAQASVARAMALHLEDGQVVFAPPGSFGSYLMASLVREAGARADVAFAESGTLPYLARKQAPGEVAITRRATRLPTGVLPGDDSPRVLALLRRLFKSIEPCTDALDAALTNAGPIIHPPLIVLNAGAIEHFPAWDIHNEGTQASVRRVQDALDEERIAVRTALGYGPPHFALRDHYTGAGEEWMYGDGAQSSVVVSSHWREPLDLCSHRYMREDVACGLAFLVSLGDRLDVAVPVARGLVAIASAMIGEDLRATGRTLETLGLAGLGTAELRSLVARGLGD